MGKKATLAKPGNGKGDNDWIVEAAQDNTKNSLRFLIAQSGLSRQEFAYAINLRNNNEGKTVNRRRLDEWLDGPAVPGDPWKLPGLEWLVRISHRVGITIDDIVSFHQGALSKAARALKQEKRRGEIPTCQVRRFAAPKS